MKTLRTLTGWAGFILATTIVVTFAVLSVSPAQASQHSTVRVSTQHRHIAFPNNDGKGCTVLADHRKVFTSSSNQGVRTTFGKWSRWNVVAGSTYQTCADFVALHPKWHLVIK